MEVDGKAGKRVDKRIPQVYDTNKKGIHWYTKPLELLPTEREGIENGKNYRSCKRKLYLSDEVSEDQGPLGGELFL